MAEVDGQEKTEQPTNKKLDDSRDKGEVAKSMEINSFAVFTAGLMILFLSQKLLGELFQVQLFDYPLACNSLVFNKSRIFV